MRSEDDDYFGTLHFVFDSILPFAILWMRSPCNAETKLHCEEFVGELLVIIAFVASC